MIRTESVSLTIAGKTLLQACSCTFETGTFSVLLGPNGAGKSTLLKTISGDFPHLASQVYYDQTPLSKIPVKHRAQRRAVLSQHWHLPFNYRVREVIEMARPGIKPEEYFSLSETLGLTALLERDYTTLSGGEQQRVQLVRTLSQLSKHPIQQTALLLDEPLSAQDLKYQIRIMQLLEQQSRLGRTIIAIMHDLQWAALFADQALLIKTGEIQQAGKPSAVLKPDVLERIFEVNMTTSVHPTTQQEYPVVALS